MKWLNISINWFLFATGILLLGTALLLEWRLPHSRFGAPMTFLGGDRHLWLAIHAWIGAALATGVALHLTTHWRWIWRVGASRRRWSLISVGVAAVAVLAFFVLVPTEPLHAQRQSKPISQSQVPALRSEAEASDQAGAQKADSEAVSNQRNREQRRGDGPGRGA